jgi:hypothetical protein
MGYISDHTQTKGVLGQADCIGRRCSACLEYIHEIWRDNMAVNWYCIGFLIHGLNMQAMPCRISRGKGARWVQLRKS